MKKRLALLLALVMTTSLVLAACGNSGDTTDTSDSNEDVTADEAADDADADADADDADADDADTDDDADEEEDEVAEFHPEEFQVKALDDKTLEVTLNAKTPYFLELTAFPVYSPVRTDIIDEVGEAWATDPATYIGNGAYQVTEWVTDSHITFEKNENYWDVDSVGPETIVFSLMEDDTARYNSYQTDELQYIYPVPTDMVETLKEGADFHSDPQLGTYYISFNTQEAPFDDPLVRQAFTLAIDRDYLANVVGNGLYNPAGAYVPDGMNDAEAGVEFREVGGDYYDALAYEENLAQAKEVLAEAGYADGEGLPTIEYIYNDTSLHKAVAEALQDMWGELGADVSIEVQEWSTFLNTRKNGEYMVARDGWVGDYNDPICFLDMFITGGGNNNAQWSNSDYDAMISQAKSTDDAEERMQVLHDMEDMLFDEWVVSPVMYYSTPYLQDPVLDDTVWTAPLGYQYFMFADGFEDLQVSIGPNPDTIDPALNSSLDGATMIIHTFEGLYRLNKDGDTEPAVAEDVEISEDGLTYTFTLRDDAAWSDGEAITAQDFVDSWLRAIDPETAADYAYMFDVVAGYAEATGDDGDH